MANPIQAWHHIMCVCVCARAHISIYTDDVYIYTSYTLCVCKYICTHTFVNSHQHDLHYLTLYYSIYPPASPEKYQWRAKSLGCKIRVLWGDYLCIQMYYLLWCRLLLYPTLWRTSEFGTPRRELVELCKFVNICIKICANYFKSRT